MEINLLAVSVCCFGIASTSFCRAVNAQAYLPVAGSPYLLKGKTTVALQTEIIRITIGEKTVKADCTYTFKNNGAASIIKMGVPDADMGTGQQGASSSVFESFTSYVDGRKTGAKFLRVRGGKNSWQVTTIPFRKNQRRVVRNVFTLPNGVFVTDDGAVNEVSYLLNTGASWRGNIGQSNITITFSRTMGARQLTPVALSSVAKDLRQLYKVDWPRHSEGHVIYQGPTKPIVKGKTLRFTRSNWNPSQKDNVMVWFGFRTNEQMAP